MAKKSPGQEQQQEQQQQPQPQRHHHAPPQDGNARDDGIELISSDQLQSLEELRRIAKVDALWLDEFIAHGTLAEKGEQTVSAISILRVRRAHRLQHDFNLNMAGTALVLDLLDEIEHLKSALHRYRR